MLKCYRSLTKISFLQLEETATKRWLRYRTRKHFGKAKKLKLHLPADSLEQFWVIQ
jgi:hypothetical protein